MQDKIKTLIQGNGVCALATVWGVDPHCSLMSYVADEDGREIYLLTRKSTKKYRNLKENPSVSILIDSRDLDPAHRVDQPQALTVSGTVQRATDEGRKAEILRRLLARHPHLESLAAQPDAEVVVVKVKAFQLLDGITDAYYEAVD